MSTWILKKWGVCEDNWFREAQDMIQWRDILIIIIDLRVA